MPTNRRFALRQRPHGRIDNETFELVEEDLPALGEGEALIRTEWISVDPTNRGWISDAPGYLPPVAIGETVRALGMGRVVESRHPDYEEGQLVQGLIGWTEHFVASDAAPLQRVPVAEGVSPSLYLGVLGMTGLTAWVGMREIGKPREGETVVVSAAAGAVGSVAGQLAKREGARVVGIAGGPEKCALLTERLGFDAAVDHRAEDWRDQLKAATPDGIDVDFENVGGDLMDAIFGRLNVRAPRRPLRPDLLLQRHRAPTRPGQLPQPARPTRHPAGLHHPRPFRQARRGLRPTRRVGGRRQPRAPGDRRRGLRAAAHRDQHALRRRQRGQARRPSGLSQAGL
jgi:NADPH-dependent curcumin reductase CurA